MKQLDVLEKKALIDAQYYSHDAANAARKLLDSKYIEGSLTAKELSTLEKATRYLTALESKYKKLYDEYEPWKN